MTQARWQQPNEWPLAIVAAIFLATYAWEVVAELQKTAGAAFRGRVLQEPLKKKAA